MMTANVCLLYGCAVHRQRLGFPIPLQQVSAFLCPINFKLKVEQLFQQPFFFHCNVLFTNTPMFFLTELFLYFWLLA